MAKQQRDSAENRHGLKNGSCEEKQAVIVVMVPLPAQGHLNQLLHFSRLISSYGIPVHFVGTATHNRQARTRIHGWDPVATSNLHFLECPTPSFQTPPPNPSAPIKFPSHLMPAVNSTLQLRKPIYEILRDLASSTKKMIVIHDSFMRYVIQDVPSIPNAESYCFDCCSAFTIYSYFWEAAGKPDDFPEAQLLKRELPSSDTCVSPEWTEYSQLQQQSRKANWGNIFNSCKDIDGPYLDLLAKAVAPDTDKYWALGPFNPVVFPEEKNSHGPPRHKCLEWLDKQTPNSVILVSFGTTTSLTDEEINEIAVGLERSEQKFIWVLRDADKGDIFKDEEVRKGELPEEYEERINGGRGMIVRDWAPQLEILGHPSTGGFMSHCGWNSTIESISMGVPIAAWPMHSDQPRNAILITEYLRIGVNVRDWSSRDELVTSETIEDVVRKLMDSNEGEEMRSRAAKLSDTIKKSVQEGGSTRSEMDSFIAHISADSQIDASKTI